MSLELQNRVLKIKADALAKQVARRKAFRADMPLSAAVMDEYFAVFGREGDWGFCFTENGKTIAHPPDYTGEYK